MALIELRVKKASERVSSSSRGSTYCPICELIIPVASNCSLVQYSAKSAVLYLRPLLPSAALIALKYSILQVVSITRKSSEKVPGTRHLTAGPYNPRLSSCWSGTAPRMYQPRCQFRCRTTEHHGSGDPMRYHKLLPRRPRI